MQLRTPSRFRFLDAADIATYGDRWWTWDEVEIVGLKARELVAIEEVVGPVMAVLRGLRVESTLATMAAMWIAITRAGNAVDWDTFNPVVFAAEWGPVAADPLDGGEAPEPDSDSSTAATESTESAAS